MSKKNKFFSTRTNKMLCALFFTGVAAMFCGDAFGQSARWKLTGRVAPSPAMRQYLANLPDTDIDLYVGTIVRKDGDYVIVNIVSPNNVKDRVPMYYACDVKMKPTAILENAKISHRTCATFKTISGTALVGDTVMVKYFAPEKQGRSP